MSWVSRTLPVFVSMIFAVVFFALPAHAQAMGQNKAGEGLAVFILAVVVLAVPVIIAFAGFSLLLHGLFPEKVEWTGEIARRIPWGSFFLGLVVTLVLLFLVALLGNAGGVGGLFAVLILLAFLVMFVGFGKAAVIELAGEMVDPSASGIRRAILGATSLYALLMVPILGMILLAGIGFMGLGAAMLSYRPPRISGSPISAHDPDYQYPIPEPPPSDPGELPGR